MSEPELEKVLRHSRGRNMVMLLLLSLLLQNRQLECNINSIFVDSGLSQYNAICNGRYEFSRRGDRREKHPNKLGLSCAKLS